MNVNPVKSKDFIKLRNIIKFRGYDTKNLLGIPFHNKRYMQFLNTKPANLNEFARLVLDICVRQHKKNEWDLRYKRNRQKVAVNVKQCAFMLNVNNKQYQIEFRKCFTDIECQKIKNLDLERHETREEKKARGKHPIIIVQKNLGVKKDNMKKLYVLMRIYKEYWTKGVIYGETAPWVAPVSVDLTI